jgi:hypothetical protein
MGLLAKKPEGASIDPIPEDTYQGVCYMVVHLGTQHNEMFNTDTEKVLIGWEVPDVRIELEREGKMLDLPRAISQEYTLSLHEKAKLRHMLENWRGKAFTKEELAGFDLKNLLGVNAMIQVLHKISEKSGNTYAVVSNVSKLYKSMEKKSTENEHQYFSFEDDMEIPGNIPEWIRDKIIASYEYQEMIDGASHDTTADNGMSDMPEAGDDVPF